MSLDSKHILLLIKFHPERELRLIQEFCKKGYTYDVVAPSYRIAADWKSMMKAEGGAQAQDIFILPAIVKELQRAGKIGSQLPKIATDLYEKAVVTDKLMSKWGSQKKISFFLNCYLHIIDTKLYLQKYSIIIGEISSAFEFLLFQKAKALNIPYTYFIASPITPNTFFFIDDSYQIRDLEASYFLEKENKIECAVKETEVDSAAPGYMVFNNNTSINNVLKTNRLSQKRISRLYNFFRTYRVDSKFATDFVPTFSFYLRRLTRLYRFFTLKTFGDSLWQKEVQKEQYVLFLQYEPEITTSLYAYPFKSQQEWIEVVLENLEEGNLLYIKEHPAMFSQRNVSFYHLLKKHKQIRLVDPSVPSKLLIEKAKVVFTLNSTVGIECLKFGTPVISFGKAYFNFIPEVLKWEELKRQKNWTGFGSVNYPLKEALKTSYHFLECSIKQNEYVGCLNDHRLDTFVLTSENMSMIQSGIEKYVGKI